VEANQRRCLSVAVVILTLLVLALPWMTGGRSATAEAALILLVSLAGGVGLWSERRVHVRPLGILAVVLAGTSALLSIYPDRAIQALLLLGSYIMACALARRSSAVGSWARRVLLAAIGLTGIGLMAIALLHRWRGNDGGLYANVLIGPFGYPNAMAAFLLLAAGAAFTYARLVQRAIGRWSSWCVGIAFLAGIALTRSRGALLGGCVGVLVWVLFGAGRSFRSARTRAAIGAGVLLAGVAGSIFWPHLLAVIPGGGADTSLIWRARILEWTLDMIRGHPWLGVGPGGFPVALNHYQRVAYTTGENPHNLLLQIGAEYGLPLLVMVLFWLARLLWRAWDLQWLSDRMDSGFPVLLSTLVAFAVHSLVDMTSAFPALLFTAAVLFGIASADVPSPLSRNRTLPSWAWNIPLVCIVCATATFGITRYYAQSFLDTAEVASAFGDEQTARRDYEWALRLNPLSFRARERLAHSLARVQYPAEPLRLAEEAVAIAPEDANTHFLAGEMAAAAGQWVRAEDSFRVAAAQAPFAQLRFHAGLVESAAKAEHPLAVQRAYEAAIASFPIERVVSDYGRCISPGDRYRLAQISRTAALAYDDNDPRRVTANDQAAQLSQPDPRGICTNHGVPGHTSPETVILSFWKEIENGNLAGAAQYLVPEARDDLKRMGRELPLIAKVLWVYSLVGNEDNVTINYEVEIFRPRSSGEHRCAVSRLAFSPSGWFLQSLPRLFTSPC